MRERQRSHLDLTEDEFLSLSRRGTPVTIDGGRLSRDLPARHLTLEDVRIIMLKRRTSDQLKDAVWSHLVRMSHAKSDPWAIAAAGMMLPGLKKIADRMHAHYPHDACDLDSEILEAFLHELGALDPNQPAPHKRLYLAACRRGDMLCRREARRARKIVPLPDGLADHCRGNPDIALARAVLDGVITTRQAALVSRVHLDSAQRCDVARQMGMGLDLARRELTTATRGLCFYLRTG
jgi:hypothetical protein